MTSKKDGTVGLWSLQQEDEPLVLLQGHKRHVNVLVWNSTGTKLASGGGDCDVIVWDAVDQCGLYRLKGHKERITALSFLSRDGEEAFLVSASADRTIKIWRMATQHCEEGVGKTNRYFLSLRKRSYLCLSLNS